MRNMYDWIDNTRNFIGGECPHKCSYCYVKSMNYPAVKARYSGKIKLFEDEFKKSLKSKSGKPIFIGSCFDMWADEIPKEWIYRVIDYCKKFDDNKYVFQTKNPKRYSPISILSNPIIGTTVESNRNYYAISNTPNIENRITPMCFLSMSYHETFVTIEPILEFDIEKLVELIEPIEPTFVNIGADSKCHNLPEPSWDKVQALIAELKKFTEVRCKSNLERLSQKS